MTVYALAAHPAKVLTSSDNITYVECDGINSISLGRKLNPHDTTDFKSTSTAGDYLAAVTRIAGLTSYDVNISGHLDNAATGQGVLRAAKKDSALTYIKVLVEGTAGHYYTGYIKSIKHNGEAAGLCEVSYTMVCTTAPVAA